MGSKQHKSGLSTKRQYYSDPTQGQKAKNQVWTLRTKLLTLPLQHLGVTLTTSTVQGNVPSLVTGNSFSQNTLDGGSPSLSNLSSFNQQNLAPIDSSFLELIFAKTQTSVPQS